MTPIPFEKLNEYLNEVIVMESESKKSSVVLKKVSPSIIFGYNKTKKCLFEIINPKEIKFYK